MHELAFAPALEQGRLIRERQISPLELVDLYLQRIEQWDAQWGSYVTVMAPQARAQAQALGDRLLTLDPQTLSPLWGVPLSIKDLHPVAGVPCSYGLAVARQRVAQADEGVVARLRSADLVFLGKTATSQLASLPYTEPPGFPPTRNPWNPAYTPGGSSGGAAAAVAGGLCALAQGSDGGGSIRGPAHCCGIVGLKPSRGRVSMAPVGDCMGGAAVQGPLGRTVADTAALLDVMAGYIPGDPYWLADPPQSFLTQALQGSQGSLPPLRIGFTSTIPPLGTAAEPCDLAVQTTARRLEALGHHLVPYEFPDLTPLIEPFTVVWQCVVAQTQIPWFVLEKFNRWLAWRSLWVGSGAYLRALTQMQRVGRQIVEAMGDLDALVLPVYLHPPIPVGQWQSLSSPQILRQVIQWIAPCPPFNASGQPSLSVPVGDVDSQGLPLGVQLVGRPGADGLVLALGAQLEAAHPWPLYPPHLKP